MLAMRLCTKCNQTKPPSEFYERKAKPGSYYSWCKACREANRKARYEAQRELARGWGRKSSYKRQLTKYGLTLDTYDEMLRAQGDSCAICGRTPGENGRRLAVGHNHRTGGVRGLLCNRCNRLVGQLENNSELCRQAMLYLQRHDRQRDTTPDLQTPSCASKP